MEHANGIATHARIITFIQKVIAILPLWIVLQMFMRIVAKRVLERLRPANLNIIMEMSLTKRRLLPV